MSGDEVAEERPLGWFWRSVVWLLIHGWMTFCLGGFAFMAGAQGRDLKLALFAGIAFDALRHLVSPELSRSRRALWLSAPPPPREFWAAFGLRKHAALLSLFVCGFLSMFALGFAAAILPGLGKILSWDGVARVFAWLEPYAPALRFYDGLRSDATCGEFAGVAYSLHALAAVWLVLCLALQCIGQNLESVMNDIPQRFREAPGPKYIFFRDTRWKFSRAFIVFWVVGLYYTNNGVLFCEEQYGYWYSFDWMNGLSLGVHNGFLTCGLAMALIVMYIIVMSYFGFFEIKRK